MLAALKNRVLLYEAKAKPALHWRCKLAAEMHVELHSEGVLADVQSACMAVASLAEAKLSASRVCQQAKQ